MKVPFLGGAYKGRSPAISPETCENYFYEKGVTGDALVSTHGDEQFADLGDGEVRGGIAYNDHVFFVVGNTLWEVTAAGLKTSRGTIGTSVGLVSMAHNGTRSTGNQQLAIADGDKFYIYNNVTQALAEATDTGGSSIQATFVVFVDGYFAYTVANSDSWFISAQYDGTTNDPLDKFVGEGSPDEGKALVVDRREIFFIQEESTERYYNSGDADETFQRYQGGFIEKGCVAAFTACTFDNSVAWLGQDDQGNGQIVQLGEANQIQVLSTPEVNYQIAQYATISDAFAYVYQHEGHEFYVITFPSADKTWVYDALTQMWHTRAHDDHGKRERYNCHVFVFGKHLFGDFENGKIYALSKTLGTQNGTRIPRERISPSLGKDEERIRIRSLQLDLDEGFGDSNDDTDTMFWMSWSKDGGHTFSNEISREAGDLGDYGRRLVWRRLGQARNWTFRLRTKTPHPHVIRGLQAKLREEPSQVQELSARGSQY